MNKYTYITILAEEVIVIDDDDDDIVIEEQTNKEWICENTFCHMNNFPTRKFCRSCNKPKPVLPKPIPGNFQLNCKYTVQNRRAVKIAES